MHQEARLLADFLTAEGLTDVILFGHSDGASISLLYAAVNQDRTVPRIAAIISASAHTFLEDVSVAAIQRLRAGFDDGLRKPLSRHHQDVDATFSAWSGVWVSDRFSTWAIDDELGAIDCPVLAIQGSIDSYGSWAQVDRLVAGVGSEVEVLKLDDVDHWPHREATEEVLSAVAEFLAASDG